MKTLFLFATATILSSCATAPAPRATRATPTQVQAVYAAPAEQTADRSPTEYHTTYYDREGSLILT